MNIFHRNGKSQQASIVYLGDSSASMYQAETYEMGLRATYLDRAITERRGFLGIVFASDFVEFDFGFDASKAPAELRPLFEAHRIGSGTDLVAPLNVALAHLSREEYATGRKGGEIIVATDGDVAYTPEWLAGFKSEQQRLGFTVQGIAINMLRSSILSAVADSTTVAAGWSSVEQTELEAVELPVVFEATDTDEKLEERYIQWRGLAEECDDAAQQCADEIDRRSRRRA